MKTCTKCDAHKPLNEFSADKRNTDGRRANCKACVKVATAEYNGRNKDKVAARNKAWREKNTDAVCQANRAWRAQNPKKVAAQKKAYRAANPEVAREADRAWYGRNKDKVAARQKAYREENAEKAAARVKAWREKNPEKLAARVKAWHEKNPHKANAYSATRRAAQLLRTPKWLTAADFGAIERIYAQAKGLEASTGVPHHIDHIYPLQGRYVSGLHVPANLQVLTASENLSKHNQWVPK